MSNDCKHTVTQGRDGETGTWCRACGEKIYEVETQPCADCTNFNPVVGGVVCTLHLSAIIPEMRATYKITDGSCFAVRPK